MARLTDPGAAEGLKVHTHPVRHRGGSGAGETEEEHWAQPARACVPDLTPPFARCWRVMDKTILWATSWAGLTSTWLNFSTMWKSWTPPFWPTSLCWRWALSQPLGAAPISHLGICSLDPGTVMLGSLTLSRPHCPQVSTVHSKALVWGMERIWSRQRHWRWSLPQGEWLAFSQERDPGLSASLCPCSISVSFFISSLLPSLPGVSSSFYTWVCLRRSATISFLSLSSCSFSYKFISLSPSLPLSEGRLVLTGLIVYLSCFLSSAPAQFPYTFPSWYLGAFICVAVWDTLLFLVLHDRVNL